MDYNEEGGASNCLHPSTLRLNSFRHIPLRKLTAYVSSLNNIADKEISSNLIKSTWLIRAHTLSTTNVTLTQLHRLRR